MKKENILNCKKKVMITCDYDDLNNFIKAEFNLPNYEFIADEELNNDMTWTTTVEPKEMDAKELLDAIRNGKTMFKTRNLMDHLCYEGKLEAGEYAVEISW